MGASTNSVFSDAMVAYKLGDYLEARAKWAPLLRREPTNDTLRFYIASAALASGDADAAIALFKELDAQPASGFHGRSQWYLFLAYVRAGKSEEAKATRLENDGTYGERVRAADHIEVELMRSVVLLIALALFGSSASAQVEKRLADRHARIGELHKAGDHAATIKEIGLQLKESAGTNWQDSIYRYTYTLGRAVWKSQDADAGVSTAARRASRIR